MARTVTLTDEQGIAIGEADLIKAHTGTGQLHRAFSVYVFDSAKRKILIQRRSKHKMLWAGIWANTCCSHPYRDETPLEAGTRRLHEEMGFSCQLTEHGSFVYRAEDPSGKGVEHEHVTLLVGYAESPMIKAEPREVSQWKWIDLIELKKDMADHPESYAPWFPLGIQKILNQTPKPANQ